MGNFEEMEQEYLRQQTPEGQAAIKVKREMMKQFSKIIDRPLKVGIIQPLTDANTGEVLQYFIAE